jgi:hypothetical protein
MALIAFAADKGAPGVTTTAMALTSVWPRPILLAECDPSGGDLVYRFTAVGGGHLDPRRGVLSLGIAARRGMPPQQAWEHVQKMQGGIDLLAGVTNSEQGAGLNSLWGSIGRLLAGLPQADVIADCGRIGVDGPVYDLLAEAVMVVLVSRAGVADVIRLRDRAAALAAALEHRRRGTRIGVLVVADSKRASAALGEVQHVLDQAKVPAKVIGGLPDDPRSAQMFRDGQMGKLAKTPLVRSARGLAKQLVGGLPGQPEQPQQPQQPQQAEPPGRQAQPQPQQPLQPLQPQLAQPQPLQPQPQPQQPLQPQPQLAQAPPALARNSNPPGVLVASPHGRHGRAGQNTVPQTVQPGQDGQPVQPVQPGQDGPPQPGQPPANLFPPQSLPSGPQGPPAGQLTPLPQAPQPMLRPVPAREQSGRE